MAPPWIAEERVVFVYPDGQRVAGRIAVGTPEQVDALEARCPVSLDGLHKTIPVCGASTLQALLLGVRFLGMRLHIFLSTGGRVLRPEDDEDFELDALFGVLLREP